MPHDPIRADARQAQRARRLGSDASCALCGTAQLEALIPAARRLLEAHHVVGRAHDDRLTIPLCRNCHAVETERLRTAGASMRPARSFPERLVEILTALGAFFLTLGAKCAEWAVALAGFIAALDASAPAWRELPEAV